MQDLIARLEKAVEGSRELDRAIADELGIFRPKPPTSHDEDFWTEHYTTSIDAALTLVPDRWRPSSINWNDASIGVYLWEWARRLTTGGIEDPAIRYGAGKTPAIAICCAALRARAAGEGE